MYFANNRRFTRISRPSRRTGSRWPPIPVVDHHKAVG
jgi:hypothetical protein